jgi:hypothetical protein
MEHEQERPQEELSAEEKQLLDGSIKLLGARRANRYFHIQVLTQKVRGQKPDDENYQENCDKLKKLEREYELLDKAIGPTKTK